MNFVAVFVGGGLGCLTRYLVYLYIHKPDEMLPWSTLTANIASSFVLGVLISGMNGEGKQQMWYLLLATGFCGGFSTFSTFSMENFHFLQQGMWLAAFVNVIINVLLCLLAIYWGHRIYAYLFVS